MALLLGKCTLRPCYFWRNTTTTSAKRKLSISSFQQSARPFLVRHRGNRLHQYRYADTTSNNLGRFVSSAWPSCREKDGRVSLQDGGAHCQERTIIASPRPAILDDSGRCKPPTKIDNQRKGDETIFHFKKLTKEALSADHVVGSWTLRNISMIRSCMEQWLRMHRRPNNDALAGVSGMARSAARERAVWSTKILCRWVDELAVGKNPLVSEPELVQVLHRVLHAWRLLQQQLHQQHHQQQKTHSIKDHDWELRTETCTRAIELLQVFGDLAKTTTSEHSWWPSDKAYTMVLEILALHPEPAAVGTMNLAEDLLNERLRAAQENRLVPLPDLVVWNTCLHVFAKCSSYDKTAPERVEALFRRITSLPTNNNGGGGLPCVDEKSYAARLHAWARSGRPQAGERAQAILDEMIYKEKIYNRVCFNLCIKAWAQSGCPEQAEKVLWSMLEYYEDRKHQDNERTLNTEMRPDHASFMAAINAWRLSNDPRCAERVENLMSCMQNHLDKVSSPESIVNRDDGDLLLVSTTKSLNAVLDTWAGKRNSGPKVEGLLRRMIAASSKDPLVHPPSLETYTIAIKAWALTIDVMAEEAPERAEALLLELEDLSKAGHDDLTPNVIAYTAAIQAWANSRRHDAPKRALSLLRRMQHMSRRRGGSNGPRQESASPNIHTYNTVLYTFAQHGLAFDAERLFDEMKDLAQHSRDDSLSPNSMSYTNLIHAHAKNRLDDSPDRCRALLLEMEMGLDEGNERIQPTPASYSAVIKACGNHSGDDAEAVLWRMQDRFEHSMTKSCPAPTTRVCNSVLRVWADSREGVAPQRAESILRWMQDQRSKGINDSLQPDKASFDLVIKAWARSRRRRAIEHVERLMEEMKSKEPQISPDSLSREAW